MQAHKYIAPVTDIFQLGPKDRMMQNTANSSDHGEMHAPKRVLFPED